MNKLLATVALSAGVLFQSQAFAGYSSYFPVLVGSNYAEGSLRSARSSSDGSQYIGCTVGPYAGSNYVYCQGTNSAGQSYYCVNATAPDVWASTLASLNTQSLLYFYGDSNHHCLGIYVEPYSYYLPQ
jgi:hypothetical protein